MLLYVYAANVFGAPRGKTDFYPYTGAGFTLNIPAKWNPSKELGEFANVQVRFEDNFDATNNLVVIAEPTSLNSVKDLGPSPLDFIEKVSKLSCTVLCCHLKNFNMLYCTVLQSKSTKH